MIAYIDSSVFIRIALDQKPRLREWDELTVGVSSAIARVECGRAIDRHARTGNLTTDEADQAGVMLNGIFSRLDLANIDEAVINRASGAFPRPLKSLDAIHLATALLYRDKQPDDEPPIRFATHDNTLAAAARALNFDVIGA